MVCPKRSNTTGKPKASNTGENNGIWKGESVKYGSLHDWVKYHLEKPKQCQKCLQEKRLDLANISGLYKRDLSDWEWLCRTCHMEKDGRLEKVRKIMLERAIKSRTKRICEYCGSEFTVPQYWVTRGGGRFCSNSCSSRKAAKRRKS